MPNKETQSHSSVDAESASDARLSGDDVGQSVVVPATKRFRVVVALFCVWLMFLVYLALLTWSGK